MRRSDFLAPLSREHHLALKHALALKKADTHSSRDACRSFLEFWDDRGQAHFRAEEETLLPVVSDWIDPRSDDVSGVLADHVEIRRLVQRVRSEPSDIELQHALGHALDRHVRREERRLFPLIEASVPADALDGLSDTFA